MITHAGARPTLFSFTLEIEMSSHDRITLTGGSGVRLSLPRSQPFEPAKADIHVRVSICLDITLNVSCIFDLERRNYGMTCFVFVYNRLTDADADRRW